MLCSPKGEVVTLGQMTSRSLIQNGRHLTPATSDDPVMRLVTPLRVSQSSRPRVGSVTS